MKIGIYGGSFNPIHIGHLHIAKVFLAQCQLDEVWFLVSPQNPLKQQSVLLEDAQRFAMVKKVLTHHKHFVASDFEFHLPKPSYTWDTLQHLSAQYPSHQFTLLIGSDNWKVFNKWYKYQDILAKYQIAIYPRNADEILENRLPKNVVLLKGAEIDVSSTEIREKAKQKQDFSALVPSEIIEEIKAYYT